VRRLAPALLAVLIATGCGPKQAVHEQDAVREARAALVHAPSRPPVTFPAQGSRACRVARVAARCSTRTRRAQDGAVVVTFAVAWRGRRHSWTYTVPPGDAGGPRGPAEGGSPLPR